MGRVNVSFIGKFMLYVLIIAIAWPFIALLYLLLHALIFVTLFNAPNIDNLTLTIIAFPYKYWWISLILIALFVWRNKIKTYFRLMQDDVPLKIEVVSSSTPTIKRIDVEEINKDSKEESSNLEYYTCNECKKSITFYESKYSFSNQVLCYSCMNKLKNKEEIDFNSIGIRIDVDELSSDRFSYTLEEFVKFQKELIEAKKKSEFISSFKWFIKNYLRNNKIKKKELNMFLDYILDVVPKNYGGHQLTKDFILEILNKSNRSSEDQLAKEIKKAGKWDLLLNFANKYESSMDIINSSEIDRLIEVLKKYGIESDKHDLMTILAIIKSEKEYIVFKNKIKSTSPKTFDDYVNAYLYITGEQYENKLESLLNLLYDEDLLNVGLIKPIVEKIKKEKELELYERKLTDGKQINNKLDFSKISGHDFESFLSELFKKMGYKVVRTKLSGDQGADLIVEKFGEKTVIQAKNYSKPVSNKAIQEAVAAKNHYICQSAMVVTTNSFTKGAIALAKSNKVNLWDVNKLSIEIKKYL